jgi:hypothetical protein
VVFFAAVFLLVVRFFPLVFVAMVLLRFPIQCRRRTPTASACRQNHFLQVQACRPARRVNCFFHYKPLTPENIHAMAHVSRLGMSIESDRLCH